MKTRLAVVMILVLLLAAGVLVRAAQIQIIKDPRLTAMAKRQFQSKVLIRPRRGMIMDRNGEPLAINVEARSLAANPSKIQNKRTLARLLAKATDVPYEKLLERFNSKGGKREFVWIKRHLSDGEMSKLRKYHIIDGHEDLMDGLWLVKESKRIYPHKDLAAHVLGDVNLDSEGLEGAELWQDEKLRGKVTSMTATRDALGRPTFIDATTARLAKEGESVRLTIDASLQFSVQQELKAAVSQASARGGSVIVMNADTGEILAMANEPAFDPNDTGTPSSRRRNRALTDGYEPGSTFKPMLVATALSHGWKLTDRLHGENGSFVVQGRRISEAEAHEKFEWITLKKLIEVSSNVASAKLAMKLGTEKFRSGLQALGFGSKSGTGFPGEISGKLPTPGKPWTPLTLANVGFGQGILVTPMQMVRAYAAFANGGLLVQPTLLKPADGESPAPAVRVLQPKVAEQVAYALKGAVMDEEGTGKKAQVNGYEVAGKTGTAQMVDPATGKYSKSKYIASFIGFAVKVEPKLVIFASVEEPRGVYYGAERAAPLFSKVLQAAANRFSMPALAQAPAPAGSPLAGAQPSSAAQSAKSGLLKDELRLSLAKVTDPAAVEPEAALAWHSTDPATGTMQWTMPSLRGMTAREALQVLRGHRFALEVNGVGVIKGQQPEEGKLLADGATVKLSLGEP